ncbi:MAG: hypothetical protein ACK5LR_01915 [Mangrovibacterium sp.]
MSVACIEEVFPLEGYVQVYATMGVAGDGDGSMQEKQVSTSYLDSIDASTFNVYYYYARTHDLVAMPSGSKNPMPLKAWGLQKVVPLYIDTYDIVVANCVPNKYSAQSDPYLPTLNPHRGVKFISKTLEPLVVEDAIHYLEYVKLSTPSEQLDWDLQTAIVNVSVRDTSSLRDFDALDAYKVWVGDLEMANSNGSDDIAPYSPKKLSVSGVQGYFRPLLSGESYDIQLEYTREGVVRRSTIQGAITDRLIAGMELTVILENTDEGLGLIIEAPDGSTDKVDDIVFN